MSIVFVTGGSGFVGSHLIARLVARGDTVRALSRSDRSDQQLRGLGAEPVRGSLDDVESLARAMAGADLVFHAAARTSGGTREFWSDNVSGTAHVITAARRSTAHRLVHVGTEAALMAGQPLVQVDETAPLRPDSRAPYAASKTVAEQLVHDANGPDLETVVLRPRFVWGDGDTSVLPSIIGKIRAGRFAWIGGGRQLTDTTHVDNAVEGLVLAADHGHPGQTYFVTDGHPVAFRDFVTDLVATQGVLVPEGSMPYAVGITAAAALEATWRLLRRPGQPPVDHLSIWISGQECTIDTTKAREELGYEPVITREDGLERLRRTNLG